MELSHALSILKNIPLDSDTDATLLMVMRMRMRMPSLMMMRIVMRTVFGTIVKVWELIIIVVTMIFFAKTKFIMIPFAGTADLEAYLDWKLAVEQNFNSHLVPAEHR